MKRVILLAMPVLLATTSGCAVVGAAAAVGSAAVAVGSAAVYVGAKTVEVAADATVGTVKMIGKAVSSDDDEAKDKKDPAAGGDAASADKDAGQVPQAAVRP